MNYLYLFTLFVLLTGTSCSNTNESTEPDSSRVAILDVAGDKVFLDEVRADPPTEEEIKNQTLTKFHGQLSYMIARKVWEKAQEEWNVSFTDQDIITAAQAFFDKTKTGRVTLEKDLAQTEALVESMEMQLAGSDAKEVYQLYRDKLQLPYDVWAQLLVNRVQAQRDVERFDKQIRVARKSLLKSDKELKDENIRLFLKFLKPAYRSRRVAMAICDSEGIPVEQSKDKKNVLSASCVEYVADWMTKYSQNQVVIHNPVAKAYEFSISYYRDIGEFDRWMKTGMR